MPFADLRGIWTALKARQDGFELGMTGLLLLMPPFLIIGRGPADGCATLMGVLLLVRSFHKRDFAWANQLWFKAALVVWAYLLSTSAFADVDIAGAYSRCAPWIRWLLFTAAVQSLLAETTIRRLFGAVLTATVLFAAADAVFQFATGTSFFGNPIVYMRLSGPFNRPVIGIFLAFMAMPVGAACMRELRDGTQLHRRVGALAVIVLLAAAILLSGERMALMLTMVGYAVIAVWVFPLRVMLLSATGAVVVLAAVFMTSPSLAERHLYSVGRQLNYLSQSNYIQVWQGGLAVWESSPIFGVGLKNYRALCPIYLPAEFDVALVCNIHPHQIYVEWLAETGVIGLSLFLGLIVSIFKAFVSARTILRAHPLLMGGAVATGMRLWPIATAGSFFTNWNEAIFWLMLGIGLASHAIRTRSGER